MTRLNFLKKAVITASAVLVLSSCEDKEPQKLWCDCADELFYYFYDGYNFKKIFLDEYFLNDLLVVGIESQVRDEEMVDFINQTGLFKPVDASNIILAGPSEDDYVHLIFVNTMKPETCTQLKEIIQILEKSSTVAFANLAFDIALYGDQIVMNIMTFTNEFLVKLKNSDDLSVLNATISETNTQIIRQSNVDPEVFIISADKNSMGNALQMANYFHETGNFVYAEPNKLYAKINR